MRKTMLAILILSVLFCFASCSYVYTNSGIENFSVYDSEYGLNRYLIPEDFLNLFEYSDGGYDYYEKVGAHGYVTTLLYMEYDELTYNNAKEYALSGLDLVEESEEQYKNYMFLKRNSTLAQEDSCYRFYFAYSDEDRILLAVGTYMSGTYAYQTSNLSEYLETYFSFYNFDDGEIERETATETGESFQTIQET